MKNILKDSFSEAFKRWRLVTFLYCVNFGIALIFGILTYQQLKKATQSSLAFEGLLKAFDATILFDFMRFGGEDLFGLVIVAAIFLLIYLLVNIYFLGGIISQFRSTEPFEISSFFKKSNEHFFNFIALFLIQFVLFIFLTLIGLLLIYGFSLLADGGTERTYFIWMLIPTTIFCLIVSFLWCANDISKMILYRQPTIGVIDAFRKGVKHLFNSPRIFKSFWILLLICLISYYFYTYLSILLQADTGFMIFVSFLFFQTYILGKVFFKIWIYFNTFSFLDEILNQPDEVETKLSE